MKKIRKPKYILFDVGNVLTYKVTHEDENIGKLLGMSREAYRKFLDEIIEQQTEKEHRAFKEMNTIEKEKNYLDKLHKKMCMKLGIKLRPSFISKMTDCRMKGDFALKEGTIEALKSLSQQYKLGIYTNSLPSRRYHELKINNLYTYFEDIFISKEIDFEKPDVKGFKYVLSHIPFKKEDIMFIDDKLEYLEGAEKAGISNLIMFLHKDITDKYPVIQNLNELIILLDK